VSAKIDGMPPIDEQHKKNRFGAYRERVRRMGG
jgi:hypothetical protein